MYKKLCILFLILSALSAVLFSNIRKQISAYKQLIQIPYDSSVLETERDDKIKSIRDQVKDEFETTAQFELRKKDAGNQIEVIQKEYEQRIKDSRAAYEQRISQIRQKMQKLLADTRETVNLSFALGKYDADLQQFQVISEGKTINLAVPLDKAKLVKDNISQFNLKAERQLDENMQWIYANYTLQGSYGTFYTSDKAQLPATTVTTAKSIVPPALSATVKFSEPSGNNILDAEETGKLEITIQNTGKGAANLVEAVLSISGSLQITYNNKLYFGEIKPDRSVTKSTDLKASADLANGKAELKLNFSEQNGFPPDDKIITFTTKEVIPPQLIVADVGIKDANENGRIEAGEIVDVTVRIRNTGQGVAKDVIAQIVKGNEVFFFGETKDTFNLGNLEAGDFKDITISVLTSRTAKSIPISVNLKEQRNKYSRDNLPLNLALNRTERTADQLVIAGKDTQKTISEIGSLAIDIEKDIPVFAKPDKNKWAVVIGIEKYQKVPDVRFARRDAEYIQEYFQKVMGIPQENIYSVIDEKATLAAFMTLFDEDGWLHRNTRGKNSEIYIYYAGHGAPEVKEKKAYLVPYDGNPNYPKTGYSLETLYANLNKLDAKQVTVFMDACFSGLNRNNQMLLADARPVVISLENTAVFGKLSVLSAASGAQISSAYGEKSHGLFSYFLMKGMRGDADSNGDRKITYQELGDYLAENVRNIAARLGREQNPQLQTANPSQVLIEIK